MSTLSAAVRAWVLLLALTLVSGAFAFGQNPGTDDIVAILKQVPGIANLEEAPSNLPDARFFSFTFMQPLDHTNPKSRVFPVKGSLLYRNAAAPTVLFTSGYYLYPKASQSEPTRLLGANQISLEHRFFGESSPKFVQWDYCNIFQSACDSHRVTGAFKPFLKGRWLNTGGSKGGMTAIYHRRFFPDDVDCTVAYVAPLNYGIGDERYVSFVENLGPYEVSMAMEAWQQRALDQKKEIIALMNEAAAAKGLNFDGYLGGTEMALEWAILECPFVVWQYGNVALAKSVPPVGASAVDHLAFLDKVHFGNFVGSIAEGPKKYAAYNFQAATQLGAPINKESHLNGLTFPGTDFPQFCPPFDVHKAFDWDAMADIQDWVYNEAVRVIFVYGANDPWTAAAFDISEYADDMGVKKYMQPEGNHGASIRGLPRNLYIDCMNNLTYWMGVPFVRTYQSGYAPTMEEMRLLKEWNIR